MREILFRGKRCKTEEWAYGLLWHNKPEAAALWSDDMDRCLWVHPETVGQFTGLTDKNGKKVFEGDIVKIKDFSGGCYLTCEQPTSNFAVKWYGKEGRFGIDYTKLFPYDFTKSEVIGNIHDNPELLKKGGT